MARSVDKLIKADCISKAQFINHANDILLIFIIYRLTVWLAPLGSSSYSRL